MSVKVKSMEWILSYYFLKVVSKVKNVFDVYLRKTVSY